VDSFAANQSNQLAGILYSPPTQLLAENEDTPEHVLQGGCPSAVEQLLQTLGPSQVIRSLGTGVLELGSAVLAGQAAARNNKPEEDRNSRLLMELSQALAELGRARDSQVALSQELVALRDEARIAPSESSLPSPSPSLSSSTPPPPQSASASPSPSPSVSVSGQETHPEVAATDATATPSTTPSSVSSPSEASSPDDRRLVQRKLTAQRVARHPVFLALAELQREQEQQLHVEQEQSAALKRHLETAASQIDHSEALVDSHQVCLVPCFFFFLCIYIIYIERAHYMNLKKNRRLTPTLTTLYLSIYLSSAGDSGACCKARRGAPRGTIRVAAAAAAIHREQ
jgi:hypothetical protein